MELHGIESRFANIDSTLKEHTLALREQRTIQEDIMKILQRIDRHSSGQGR